jgi:hypothetical protein
MMFQVSEESPEVTPLPMLCDGFSSNCTPGGFTIIEESVQSRTVRNLDVSNKAISRYIVQALGQKRLFNGSNLSVPEDPIIISDLENAISNVAAGSIWGGV